jgi:CheY-like chemotaxis protein
MGRQVNMDKTQAKKEGKLILVVDDEPNMCNILQRLLESEGYRVIIALDGEAALEIIPRTQPDLILLDIMMPGMDGREVCKRARQICDSRIIYFTARADLAKPEKVRELSSEANAFLTKPASTRRILSVVEATLAGAVR